MQGKGDAWMNAKTHRTTGYALRLMAAKLCAEIATAEMLGWSAETIAGMSSLLQALKAAQFGRVVLEVETARQDTKARV